MSLCKPLALDVVGKRDVLNLEEIGLLIKQGGLVRRVDCLQLCRVCTRIRNLAAGIADSPIIDIRPVGVAVVKTQRIVLVIGHITTQTSHHLDAQCEIPVRECIGHAEDVFWRPVIDLLVILVQIAIHITVDDFHRSGSAIILRIVVGQIIVCQILVKLSRVPAVADLIIIVEVDRLTDDEAGCT